jgi:DNA-binding transcriptional regulator LsrR (DeoR family)
MLDKQDNLTKRLDDAARAAWLYYLAGNTQDQIATKLGVSRQSAQRLVSLAVSSGIVKFRIDHPIAKCLDLAGKLRDRFGLAYCEVSPSDNDQESGPLGIAQLAAAKMEEWLQNKNPVVIAIGTGRTLKAAVEQLSPMDCPHHRVVSLTGNISPDGSAAYYNVIFTLSDIVNVRSFPMPLPVIASSAGEREMLHGQAMIKPTLELAAQAEVTFVGVGELNDEAPLVVDGFISRSELAELRAAGAVGEIIGWAFDANGKIIPGLTNDRVASAPLPSTDSSLVIAIARGRSKLVAIRSALAGRLVNGLVTDELSAVALLK